MTSLFNPSVRHLLVKLRIEFSTNSTLVIVLFCETSKIAASPRAVD